MANRKLDMGLAWTQATGMIGANRDTIGAIAGLFFFLPAMASALLVPELAGPTTSPTAPGGGSQADMQTMLHQRSAIFAANWPLLLATLAVQFVGSMSLFALLTDRGHPTVGEALGTGIRSMPSYIAAQLLIVVAASLGIGIPIALLSAMGGAAVAVAAVFVALILIVYVLIKVSLVAPVIAIEGERNPFAALGRSWQLTKGNSLRIFVFIALLVLVIGVISTLVSAVASLVFAAFGGAVATIGGSVVSGLVNTLLTVIFLVVTVAIFRQLAGAAPAGVAELFE